MGMSRYVKAVARAQLATGFGIIVFWISSSPSVSHPRTRRSAISPSSTPSRCLTSCLRSACWVVGPWQPQAGPRELPYRWYAPVACSSWACGCQLQFAEWHLYERPD